MPYRLYGNLKGQYPVTNEVLGGFEAENMAKENEQGPAEFIINTHGQRDNIDNAIFENDEEKRISLVNMGNINEVLSANPYYLDGWCCSNGEGMAENLVTTALNGQCVGMYAATHIISNNGVQVKASPEQMADCNFYYFYYHYLKALKEGQPRSRAFLTAQQEYGRTLEPTDTKKIDRGEGNPQFNLYNLLVYHNFGVLEPNAASMALCDSKCLITQSADSVPKKIRKQSGGGGGPAFAGLQKTDGNPTGKPKKVKYQKTKQLKSGDVTVYSVTAEALDNGYTRFTIQFTAREGLNIFVFDPPNGDKIHMSAGPTTGEKEEAVFDVNAEDMKGTEGIAVNMYTGDDDRCFIFIRP